MPSRLFALSPIVCAIVACASSPGVLVLTAGELSVRVLADSVPNGCVQLLGISATDGAVEPAAKPFDGTRERATAKLQKVAAAFGADAIVIDERATRESIALEGARGSEITLGANAYKCGFPSEH